MNVGIINYTDAMQKYVNSNNRLKVVGSFNSNLKEFQISNMVQDIYKKFGVNIGTNGGNLEIYIPGDVLYRMNTDERLKKKVYYMLADYTSTEFKMTMKTLNPPVKKCTLTFNDNGEVVATLEPDVETYSQSSNKSFANTNYEYLFGNYNAADMLIEVLLQKNDQELELQNIMIGTSWIKRRNKRFDINLKARSFL